MDTHNLEMIQLKDVGNTCVVDGVKKLQEQICTLEASKDSEMINQVECHDLEIINGNIIQQLQQDIALLRVSYLCY